MQATNLRKGVSVIYNGEIHVVTAHHHSTPGNKRGFIQATLKSLKTGKIIQNKYSSTEEVETAHLESRRMQYSYSDSEGLHFMDLTDYQSYALGDDLVGEAKNYLIENMELEVQFYNDSPVRLSLPKIVVLKVVESPPWVRGDSVSNNMKPSKLETGLQIQVPIFIEEGELIKVNTDTGEYVGRN